MGNKKYGKIKCFSQTILKWQTKRARRIEIKFR